eukprot:Skav235378  [mRNA]  locus=scaffold59:473813:474073:- [translate_table: standard]
MRGQELETVREMFAVVSTALRTVACVRKMPQRTKTCEWRACLGVYRMQRRRPVWDEALGNCVKFVAFECWLQLRQNPEVFHAHDLG